MAAKRRNDSPTSDENSAKKKKKSSSSSSSSNSGFTKDVDVPELYKICFVDGTPNQRLDNIRKWEERGAISEIIWPYLVSNQVKEESSSNNNNAVVFVHACHLLAVLVSKHCYEGSFTQTTLECLQEVNVIETVLTTLLYKTDPNDYTLQTCIVHFVTVALSSDNTLLKQALMSHVTGISIYHFIPESIRELELRKGGAGARRKFAASKKHPLWIVSMVQQLLHLLEGHTSHGKLLDIHVNESSIQDQTTMYDNDNENPDSMTNHIPEQVWNYVHRSLELLIDLLSITATRPHLVTYLDGIHFNVRCRLAVGHRFARPEPLRLVQQLLSRINTLLVFPIHPISQKHLSKVEVVSMHHTRATTIQKMAYRYHPDRLQELVYAGVGVLCRPQPSKTNTTSKRSSLEQFLTVLSDDELQTFVHRLRLVDGKDQEMTRHFMLQVLHYHLTIPPYPMDQLKSFPLYPTESILWDHNVIPPSSALLRSVPVLALPKLNLHFLSYQDYLLRNFELVRLESAYGIRSDLVEVMKRVRPLLRQSNLEDSDNQPITVKTEFTGWSRMALELVQPIKILEVRPPNLGETMNSQVTAEIVIDLDPCGEFIRNEWDEIGEFDNLFLVAVDASKMSGHPAPLLQDYHLRHGSHKKWDSDDKERRIPDAEDHTFPRRYGVVVVRGCMVLQVRNEEGTILSEPGVDIPPQQKKLTKRIFKVALDPAQYTLDSESPTGTEMYQQLNLVVRRQGRENNFKSLLETIRGLVEGAGSINRVVPPWLQSLLLGHGDPRDASYKSQNVKTYAMNTVGVNKPTDFLDYGDTFLSEGHLRDSFQGKVIVDGRETLESNKTESTSSRLKYKVRMVEEASSEGEESHQGVMEAKSLPYSDNATGNRVLFTPVQVEAIRSGLSPGLTVVVGPPGTGKTDVAVQIIASLYHSFPTQRTIVITHSNAALNDIFQKVTARGDLDERYLVRLGAGERDLKTESTHDFTKIGRVAYSLQRRLALLEKVQLLSESLGISGKADRGADGSPAYTCETAEYFHRHHIVKMRKQFEAQLKAQGEEATPLNDSTDVGDFFPFQKYFSPNTATMTLADARTNLTRLDEIFSELTEYRPFELLRSQRQRADYLILKQARMVAMTCTHAAIVRSHLIELGFEYDNVVMEESGQMLEIESFIPMLLQRGQSDKSKSGLSRLKRICMMGDHNQLPPVVKNASFSKFSNLDQSLFARLIRLGVPYIQLDKQGRARAELANLYRWRYKCLGNLDHVLNRKEYQLANPGFVHTFQMINVEDFQGRGESTPTAYFYQNVGEAEYVVALFQYMVLMGYNPSSISILTTYNGQKELISDIVSQRCGQGTPLAGIRPRAISTVDQYQGQQNDYILLSLVRTEAVGHLRDIRRLVVAVSRARLGLYVVARRDLFLKCHELKNTVNQFEERPMKLQLVLGETYPSMERKASDTVPKDKIFDVEDVSHLGSVVHSLQQKWMEMEG